MKKMLAALLLSALPTFVLAGGIKDFDHGKCLKEPQTTQSYYSARGLVKIFDSPETLDPNKDIACDYKSTKENAVVSSDTVFFSPDEVVQIMRGGVYSFDKWGYRFFTLRIRPQGISEDTVYLQVATNCIDPLYVVVASGFIPATPSIETDIPPIMSLVIKDKRQVERFNHAAWQNGIAAACGIIDVKRNRDNKK